MQKAGDSQLNIPIKMKKSVVLEAQGIFPLVYQGLLTHIVQEFQSRGFNDVLQYVI